LKKLAHLAVKANIGSADVKALKRAGRSYKVKELFDS
jgi:hypothetical protein